MKGIVMSNFILGGAERNDYSRKNGSRNVEKKTIILKTNKTYYFTASAARSWVELSSLEDKLLGQNTGSLTVESVSVKNHFTNPKKVHWASEDTIDEMPFGLEIISAERYPSDMLPKTLANQSRYDIKLTSHPAYYKKKKYRESRVICSVSPEMLNKFLSDSWLEVEVLVKHKKEIFS